MSIQMIRRTLIAASAFCAALVGSIPSAAQAAAPFRVEKAGHGRPVILIPGLLSGGEVWNGTVARYRDRHELHVLTLAGFAGQPALAGDRFLEAERDAVIRYIREQRLEKPVLVGHSLGAFLAFWIAATEPELVGGVVAVDGVPYLMTLGDTTMTPERARPQAQQMLAFASTMSAEQLAAQTRMALSAQSRDTAAATLGERWGRGSDGRTMGLAVTEMMTTDLRAAVGSIRVPVTLIAAGFETDEAQRARVLERYRRQVAAIPQARVVVAANARHFVMLDDPDFLFAEMDRLLVAR